MSLVACLANLPMHRADHLRAVPIGTAEVKVARPGRYSKCTPASEFRHCQLVQGTSERGQLPA